MEEDGREEAADGSLTVEDLRRELPEQDYETLTLGDDAVAVRSLLKAKTAVKGMVLSTGHRYDERQEVCREATLKRALYELFAFVGQEQRAREKLEDCELLVESYFGPVLRKSDTGGDGGAGPAVARLSSRRENPLDRSTDRWA
ncbi:MAG: hypothetical protein K2H09_07945 [Treponemataceae bacterium]|nr:hypothetical protein [Treponemataceae bacterium]